MQRIAQSWLVLDITGSGTAMGVVTALQFIPIWVVAPLGGLLADRVDKRKILLSTQVLAGAIALILGLLVVTGTPELWVVYVLAFGLGVVGSVDNPTRHAFVASIVGPDRITNALGLSMVLVNVARVFGPALAGILIVTVGTGLCFLIDAATYLAMIIALMLMDYREGPETKADEPKEADKSSRRDQPIRTALGHTYRTPRLRVPLLIIAVVSGFSYQFEVTLPLLARYTFGGSADTFGLMFAVMGVGAIGGGLYVASRVTPSVLTMSNMSMGMGVAMVGSAVAPTLEIALVALFVVGWAVTALLVAGNSTVQLNARPDLLGRVLAIHALALLGMRPLFAPLVGWVAETLGPRHAIGLGAGVAMVAALVSRPALHLD